MLSDLYLLGVGIYSTTQLTLETIQVLKKCKRTFVLHDDKRVLSELAEYTPEIVDLIAFYEGVDNRIDAYNAIAAHLVKIAKQDSPIAFVLHGHPLFLVSASEYTLKLAREEGLSVKVVPAVSSFDTILCELELDLGYALQMFDATTMILKKFALNPKIPLLVFQLATVLEPRILRGKPDRILLAPLVQYLLQWYPESHEVEIIHSPAFILEHRTRVSLPLVGLAEHPEIELWKRPTLYVPEID